MEQRYRAAQNGGGPGGLLPTLDALVKARSNAPGMTVEALSFHQGTVDMKILAHDAASLDHVSRALRAGGWDADLTSGNNVANGYEGRILVHVH
jgi:hypothetical protein